MDDKDDETDDDARSNVFDGAHKRCNLHDRQANE
jgi:hypothetical protein